MTDRRTKQCRLPFRAALLAAVLLAAGPSCKQAGHRSHEGHASRHAHHRFENANEWAAKFEDPKRDDWQRPEHVLTLLDLDVDSKVADIGSATGYFPVRLARACPKGMVYGLDIEADMVRYLNDRAAREGLTNLKSIQCTADDPNLPEPVDLIFLCNTNHHIEDRTAYFRRCRSLLRPGGRIVNIDWHTGERPIGPSPEHSLSAETAIREMEVAGYSLVKRDDSLPYQYVLVFEVEGGRE